MFRTSDIHKTLCNQSGFILATVILFILILTVVAISIMSLNVSQTTSGQSVVDTIKAEQLAIGAFYQHHQLRMKNCPNPPCTTAGDCTTCSPNPTPLDFKTFNIVVNDGGVVGSNLNDTRNIDVDVYY